MNADNSWFPELRMIVDDRVYEIHLTYEADNSQWRATAEFRLSEMCTASMLDWEAYDITIESALDALADLIKENPLDTGLTDSPTSEELDELAGVDDEDSR